MKGPSNGRTAVGDEIAFLRRRRDHINEIARMKISCFLLLLLTALAAVAQTGARSQPVTAVVDASKTGPPISPYVYGQFLEHIGSLMYGSLWSEMLDDRKFYFPVGPKPAEEPDASQRLEHIQNVVVRKAAGPLSYRTR